MIWSLTTRVEQCIPISFAHSPSYCMSTPKVDRSRYKEGNDQIEISLFPSPHPSIEEDSTTTSAVPQFNWTPKIRAEIKEGKQKAAKIKVERDRTIKENKPLVVEKSSRTSSSSSQPAVSTEAADPPESLTSSKSDCSNQHDDHQRLKSTVAEKFRIQFKPKDQNESRSERNAKRPVQ